MLTDTDLKRIQKLLTPLATKKDIRELRKASRPAEAGKTMAGIRKSLRAVERTVERMIAKRKAFKRKTKAAP